MSMVLPPKQTSFSCASSSLFLLFVMRKLSGETPAEESCTARNNSAHLETFTNKIHVWAPTIVTCLNRPHESKWNRNVAQALGKHRKEIRKLFWPIFTQIKSGILIRSELGCCSAGHGHLAATIRLIAFSQIHIMMPTSSKAIQFRGLPPNSQKLPNLAFGIPVLNLEFKPIQMLYSIHTLFMLTQSRY